MAAGDVQLAQVAQAAVAGVEGGEVGDVWTAWLAMGEELGQPGPLPHHGGSGALLTIFLLICLLHPAQARSVTFNFTDCYDGSTLHSHTSMLIRSVIHQEPGPGGVLSHQTMVLQ